MEKLLKFFLSFLTLVWRMRRHQDAWFRNKRQGDLIDAKKYERMVDAWFKQNVIFEGGDPVGLTEQVEQASLFEEAENGTNS